MGAVAAMTSKPPLHERRQRRRHPVADVRASVLFSHKCQVLNLSSDGMAVLTSVPLSPGRSYTLTIEGGAPQLRLPGTVAWCRLQGTRRTEEGESLPRYAAGIDLQSELSDNARELLELLQHKGVIQLERRLDGYLVPHGAAPDSGKASSFAVQGLSYSGMVVYAPLSVEVGDLLDLHIETAGGPIELSVRVGEVRPLEEREGRAFAELTLEYAEIADQAREALEVLIREELGLKSAEEG